MVKRDSIRKHAGVSTQFAENLYHVVLFIVFVGGDKTVIKPTTIDTRVMTFAQTHFET